MAGITSALLFFKPSATPGNAATGFVAAANGVTTNNNGIVVADTAVGVLQTGQSIAAVVSTTSRLVPGAGAVLGLVGGGLAADHIRDDLAAGRPVAISDVASLAANALTVVGSVAALAVLIIPATVVGGAASVVLVPVTFLAVAAGGIQFAANGFAVDKNGNVINTNFTPAQQSYLDSIAQSIRFAPDGITPLGVNLSTTNGNTRIETAWTQDTNTGNYFKYESISTLRSDGSVVSATQTQYKYNTDGLPISGVSNAIDGNGKVTGGANLVIGPDGKTWVSAAGTAPVITPGTGTPVHIDTLGIQTDAVPNSAGLTITSTINNQTGATSAVLRDGAGTPVLSAGSGQTLQRDPVTGTFTVTNTATTAHEIYDPVTGNRVFVQADGSGLLASKGVDANGYPNPDIYFNAGGLVKNANGSLTITPVPNGDGTPAPAVTLLNPTDTYVQVTNSSGGSSTFAVSNRAGVLQSTATAQTYDDGTQLVTVNYASGLQSIITTATDNTSKQVDYPVPGNLNIKEVTNRDAAGNITDKTTVAAALDANGVVIPNSYLTTTTIISGDTNGVYTQVDRSFDVQGNLTSTATTIRATAGGELTTTVDSKVGGNDVSVTYSYDANKAPVVQSLNSINGQAVDVATSDAFALQANAQQSAGTSTQDPVTLTQTLSQTILPTLNVNVNNVDTGASTTVGTNGTVGTVETVTLADGSQVNLTSSNQYVSTTTAPPTDSAIAIELPVVPTPSPTTATPSTTTINGVTITDNGDGTYAYSLPTDAGGSQTITDNSNGAAVVTTFNQDGYTKRYKNRSCLRTYLLGCGTKTYLKTAKSCAKLSATRARNRNEAQKRANLGSKSGQSRLFMGEIRYEINSKTNFQQESA